MRIFSALFGYLFPARCIDCEQQGFWICPKCRLSLSPAKNPDHPWIISVWNYKDPRIKKLLWKLKFENKFSVLEDLGATLYDHLADELTERLFAENFAEPLLVPIPLSAKSFKKRGYNQSKMIAQELARRSLSKLSVADALEKHSDTPTQHSIHNRRERLDNLRGVFSAKDTQTVKGRNIIIIDDITTTHATLIEARRALRETGAKKIIAFTIAH